MSTPHHDPALDALLLPFKRGDLAWPAAGIHFLRARDGAALRQFPLAPLICEQSFKPEAEALQRAGLRVSDGVDEASLANSASSRTGKVREHVYLGDDPVAIRERDAPTNVYTYRYLHTDGLGSALVETDATQTVLERSEYEPYGALTNRAEKDDVGYTGHRQDASTGLTYMQQRYYDSQVGKFLSVDPVTAYESPGSNFNRYVYAAANPYTYIDPDGRDMRVPQPGAQNDVQQWLAARSSRDVTVGPNGQVAQGSSAGQGTSVYYADKIDGLISASQTVNIQVLDVYIDPVTFTPIPVDSRAGGGLTRQLPNGDIDVVISGNANNSLTGVSGNPLLDGPAEILMHEIVGHVAPMILGSDTGNAVDNENKVRSQTPGGDLRQPEPNHVEK